MKPKLDIITLDDVRSWEPCEPLETYTFVPPNWRGTVFDILDCNYLSVCNRLWLVVRKEIMELTDIKNFAFSCSKRVAHYNAINRSDNKDVSMARNMSIRVSHNVMVEGLDALYITDASQAALKALRISWDAAMAVSWEAAIDLEVSLSMGIAAAWQRERDAQIQILKEILSDGN